MLPKMNGTQLCEARMRERAYALHRDRLERQTARIDNAPPASCAHVPRRGERAARARAAVVDRENAQLVQRMVHIMQTRGGGIDMGEPGRDHAQQNNKAASAQRQRVLAQQRIARENVRLLARLTQAKPTYSTAQLSADRACNEVYAQRISRYPYTPFDRSSYAHTLSRTDAQTLS